MPSQRPSPETWFNPATVGFHETGCCASSLRQTAELPFVPDMITPLDQKLSETNPGGVTSGNRRRCGAALGFAAGLTCHREQAPRLSANSSPFSPNDNRN